MANNEPNKPDKVKTTPAQEVKAEEKAVPAKPPAVGDETPAPEKPVEKSASQDIGKDGLEPPTPVDIPAPGDVVVSFDKINEIISEKQAAVKEAEQAAPKNPQPEKSGPGDKKAEPTSPAG